MISFSSARNKESHETGEPFSRMAQTLLQAIGLHAVEGEPGPYGQFRATIDDLQTKLTQDPAPANVLLVTGAAVQALQQYNAQVTTCHSGQNAELQRMVGMLTSAMSEFSADFAVSISQLKDLPKAIAGDCRIDQLRLLRTRLSESLESIRTEAKRQRDDSPKTGAQLDPTVHPSAAVSAREGLDPVTGLGQQPQAEQAIQEACDKGANAYVGMFLVDRIHAINSRFGEVLGNKLLVFFLQYASQGLSPTDQFFRWGRGTFLAVMERPESYEQVRRELARLFSRRLEQTFEMGERSVIIPVNSTWVLVPLSGSTPAEVRRKLDAFLATSQGQAAG